MSRARNDLIETVMISYICGKVSQRKDSSIVLEVNGISYEVLIPGAIMKVVEGYIAKDGILRLVTFHYHQVEPSRSTPVLVGFLNEVEREFFECFITVSGIGPKAAVRALNTPFSTIAKAIYEGDLPLLKSLPGIGEQRAREIIAKLQGKVGKYALIQDREASEAPKAEPDFQAEALEILLQLQYKKAEAKEMLRKALERAPDVKSAEELLNEVYRQRVQKPSDS